MNTLPFTRFALASFAIMPIAACSPGEEPAGPSETFSAIGPEDTVQLVGTEPFWSATIDGETLVWKTPDNPDGAKTSVERFAGNNGLGLTATLAGDKWVGSVTPGSCSDGMSDRDYPYTVTVNYREKTLFGCGFVPPANEDGD